MSQLSILELKLSSNLDKVELAFLDHKINSLATAQKLANLLGGDHVAEFNRLKVELIKHLDDVKNIDRECVKKLLKTLSVNHRELLKIVTKPIQKKSVVIDFLISNDISPMDYLQQKNQNSDHDELTLIALQLIGNN